VLTKFVLSGQFATEFREATSGQLDVYVGEHELMVGPPQRGLSSERLHVAPFRGSMFLGINYSVASIVEHGYELMISGSNVGLYADGGGKDGEFDEFKVMEARIQGTFDANGLRVRIVASTLSGAQVCYSANERRENAYKPIVVRVEFVVPPRDLTSFLGLRAPLDSGAFAKFNWRASDALYLPPDRS
jgi:hypothetical protein